MNLNNKERSKVVADLTTDVLFVLMPFALLLAVKLLNDSLHSFLFATDWALAASVIFGQVTSRIAKAVGDSDRRINGSHFGLHIAKRMFLFLVSIAIYFGMLFKPSYALAAVQMFFFLLAIWLHFSDGIAAYMLQNAQKSTALKTLAPTARPDKNC